MKPFSDQYDAMPLAHPPLERVAYEAFERLSFTFPRAHLEHLIAAALSPDASDNDRSVCACMLKNALIAREGRFPLCQDTGIATVFGWKKGTVACAAAADALAAGAKKCYDERKLRFSTACPASFYEEYDPNDNIPAQVAIFDADARLAPPPSFVAHNPPHSLSLLS